MITLVLGGNKSGKSDFALDALLQGPRPHRLLATGKALDLDFRKQIMDHRRTRPASLAVCEVSLDLPAALDKATKEVGSALVDSLDYWLFSCIGEGLHKEKTAELVSVLSDWTGPELFLVSSEVGLGPLAATAETRLFARRLGALNQAVAAIAHRAYLITAGLPVKLK